MTDTYYVERKAENLKTGDMFCSWAVIKNGSYPEPKRVLDIKNTKNRNGRIKIRLDDVTFEVFPEHILIVQEVA